MGELDTIRREVCELHAELPRNGLVVWTGGNLSARVPGNELMVIKPSGVPYDELTPDAMVVCDLDGNSDEAGLVPSSDAATHGYVYRHLPDVGGIVHTHSPYATAWAIGGEIPVGPFALIGDEEIGRGVVETLESHRSSAVLMRGHGVFALGTGPREAVKSAVMCEEAARIVHAARSLGPIESLDPGSIDALYHRYQNVYGQR